MRIHRILFILFILSLLVTSCSAPAEPAPAPIREIARSGPADSPAEVAPPKAQPPKPTLAPASTPTRAPIPPMVVRTSPDRGQEQLLAAPVSITFDQPMDPASTSAAFSIEPKASGDVRVKGNQLIFSPAERLKRDAEYVVNVGATASSAAGLRLTQPVSLKFKTAGFLQVTDVQPADKSDGVPVDAALMVAFNRPVVPLNHVPALRQVPGTSAAVGRHAHRSRRRRMDHDEHLPAHAGEPTDRIHRLHRHRARRTGRHDRRRAGRAIHVHVPHRRSDRDPMAAQQGHGTRGLGQRQARSPDHRDILHADGSGIHRGGVQAADAGEPHPDRAAAGRLQLERRQHDDELQAGAHARARHALLRQRRQVGQAGERSGIAAPGERPGIHHRLPAEDPPHHAEQRRHARADGWRHPLRVCQPAESGQPRQRHGDDPAQADAGLHQLQRLGQLALCQFREAAQHALHRDPLREDRRSLRQPAGARQRRALHHA